MMKFKDNITKFSYCYGCGVCAASCPIGIIKIRLNEDGFYAPYIESIDKCKECGVCLDVCAFNYDICALHSEERKIKSWAGWSNDDTIRLKCSSGGIGFEIGRQYINRGYQVIGCRYNREKQNAEHFISTTVDEFVSSIGSKYIQSYTECSFRQIKRNGQKYLITGTPCQIDSFRRMIRKFRCEDNFILIDFYCHSVPSMFAWKSYIKMLERKVGTVTNVSWRNKFEYGCHNCSMKQSNVLKLVDWHDSYNLIIMGSDNIIQSKLSEGDVFYELFLGDYVLGPQCQNNCKYKIVNSSADIRIGDLWGKTYCHDNKGVSAVVAITDKGRQVIENLENITLIEHPIEVVAEGQMRVNAVRKPFAGIIMWYLKRGCPIDQYFKSLLFIIKVIAKFKSIIKKR